LGWLNEIAEAATIRKVSQQRRNFGIWLKVKGFWKLPKNAQAKIRPKKILNLFLGKRLIRLENTSKKVNKEVTGFPLVNTDLIKKTKWLTPSDLIHCKAGLVHAMGKTTFADEFV